MRAFARFVFGVSCFVFCWNVACHDVIAVDKDFIPRKQTKPPNQPYSPAEAIARMTVPEGFTVELVAAEPDVVNPVAMTFDERGRIWVTESFEYPRKEAGKGRDRVKILEDTDNDGAVDKVSIFAEGLNIPSGIAVGHGGVWVANSPDILYYPDADRDGTADGPPEVVVTGFGRADTHELPNSLTWGPDGYLYGLNGVFNPSKIVQNGKTFEFTCAMFRIDPRTREFSLFCEGTSNPWGIAFNDNGDAFVSACVIDHLWHLVETGYYHRQGGPYPPFTWKLGSIVDYKHQMAAYCGITWFDSDAYPEKYRQKLYMGNVHGGCINVDSLERNGATYKGKPEPDFLTANDAWFMPVVQKTGPDGCLYILDWYDRYHCYQDANYDPAGVDRAKGRLYRVRYQSTPRAKPFDLTKETDDQLIERLKSPNIFYREIAQRLLLERPRTKNTHINLQQIIADDTRPVPLRLRATWALNGTEGGELWTHQRLWESGDPALTAWSLRMAGNHSYSNQLPELLAKFKSLANSENTAPEVRLQLAIASAKIGGNEALELLIQTAAHGQSDSLLDHIVWQNLLPHFQRDSSAVMQRYIAIAPKKRTGELFNLTQQVLNRWLADDRLTSTETIDALERMLEDGAPYLTLGQSLEALTMRIQSGELPESKYRSLAKQIEPILAKPMETSGCALASDAAINLSATLGLPRGRDSAREAVASSKWPEGVRLARFDALVFAQDERAAELARMLLSDPQSSPSLKAGILDGLVNLKRDDITSIVLDAYPKLAVAQQPVAVELLTSRVAWSNALIDAITAGSVPKDAVNVNQIRKLLKTGDKKLAARVEQTWGKLRTDRNPQREQVVADMKKLLVGSHGDAAKGQVVYMKLCGQCHKLHGTGQDVGPDITNNGRASFEQLVNNVFDPSLVIGPAYQARTVVTSDGRVLTGLLTEDSPQRVVLKLQGGKLETIARSDVEEMEVSKLSLMPEGVEKQLSPQELIDLFALLKLDKTPTDPAAKSLPNFTELK